jgi:hypothetical protein
METKKIFLAAIASLSLANFNSSFAMQDENGDKDKSPFMSIIERTKKIIESGNTDGLEKDVLEALRKVKPEWKKRKEKFHTLLFEQKNVDDFLDSLPLNMVPLLMTAYIEADESGEYEWASLIKEAFTKKSIQLLKSAIDSKPKILEGLVTQKDEKLLKKMIQIKNGDLMLIFLSLLMFSKDLASDKLETKMKQVSTRSTFLHYTGDSFSGKPDEYDKFFIAQEVVEYIKKELSITYQAELIDEKLMKLAKKFESANTQKEKE